MANLHFFDAISPILDGDSIDMSRAFFGTRYAPGDGDYLNCPLTREEYDVFYDALRTAGRVDLKEFEETPYFEGCLPIEVMAERGRQTLLFGPMKPVGLRDERTGSEPYAVVQLRREDAAGADVQYGRLPDEADLPRAGKGIPPHPGLAGGEVFQARQHPQKYLHQCARRPGGAFSSRTDERIFFAGQITGVEGYMESTAMGLLAGVAALYRERGREFAAARADHLHRGALPVHRDGEEGFSAHERELRAP